jgi:threonine/homoserine/homoserine lactone efflux protein
MSPLFICMIALALGYCGSVPLAGPVSVMVVSRAARKRFGEALRVGLGAAVAEGVYAGIAFFGITSLLARDTAIAPISRGASAVVAFALGIHFVRWRPKGGKDKRESKVGTALLGFSVSAANPTLFVTWTTVAALLYSKGPKRPPPAFAIPFGLCVAVGVGAWFFSLVALLRAYEKRLPERALTWAVRSMGVFLVALGVWSGFDFVRWLQHR